MNKITQSSQLTVEQRFYLIQQLNLREQQGVKSTFSSLQGGTFNEKTMVLVTQNNRGIIYVCDQMMTSCSKSSTLVVPPFVSIYASALSQDQKFIILGGSTGLLYVFIRKNPASVVDFEYILVGTLNQSKESINSIRLGPFGYDLWAGGSDKIARYYVYNQTADVKFTLKQTFDQMPSQILFVNFLQQKIGLKMFFLMSSQSATRIFKQDPMTENFTFLSQIRVPSTAFMAPSVYVSSENLAVVAIGTNQASVQIYYSNQQGFTFAQELKQTNFGSIISLAFSQNGDFLVVGNHNFETYIYKRQVLENGNYKWILFQTLRFSQNVANFCKVVKISPDGQFLITGSDDLYIRFYTFGLCPGSTQFDGYGRCKSSTNIGLIVGIVIGIIVLILFGVFVYKRMITVPAESKMPMARYDLYQQPNSPKKRIKPVKISGDLQQQSPN